LCDQADLPGKPLPPRQRAGSLHGTRLIIRSAQDIAPSYARTLEAWRNAFFAHEAEVRALGFDDRFIRTWDYYLAYCEAAFQEGHIGNVQLMFTKTRKGRLVMLEQGAREVMAATE